MPVGINKVSRNSQISSAIPDSQVSRDPDDSTGNGNSLFGIRFKTEVTWDTKIGGELSGNQDNSLTRAYIYRVSDEILMGDVDITGLTGGDTFTIDLDNPLEPFDGTDSTRYNFVVDAEGSDYNTGFDSDPTFQYNSSDNNLSIINGASGKSGTATQAISIFKIGNVGFS